jgi:hypothetical protein
VKGLAMKKTTIQPHLILIIYFVEHFVPSCTFAEKLFLVLHGREFKGNKLKTQNERVSEKKKNFFDSSYQAQKWPKLDS